MNLIWSIPSVQSRTLHQTKKNPLRWWPFSWQVYAPPACRDTKLLWWYWHFSIGEAHFCLEIRPHLVVWWSEKTPEIWWMSLVGKHSNQKKSVKIKLQKFLRKKNLTLTYLVQATLAHPSPSLLTANALEVLSNRPTVGDWDGRTSLHKPRRMLPW